MQIAYCPKCAYGNLINDKVAFGNIECRKCGNVFSWSRNNQVKYLSCCECGKVLLVANMYTIDACSKECQDKLDKEEKRAESDCGCGPDGVCLCHAGKM